MNQLHPITAAARLASGLSLGAVIALIGLFLAIEPTVSRGASASSTDVYIVRQQITGEISFSVPPADVVMVGSLNGITGGTATGTTLAVVRTNSATGYTLDIRFSNSPAMRGETTGSQALRNYGSTTQPTYGFFASTSAQFAYTVSSVPPEDVDFSFINDGVGSCNAGSTFTANVCWMGPSTTNFRIIDKTDSAAQGATTSITFRITLPSNPAPVLEEDFYTATATLTAVTQ